MVGTLLGSVEGEGSLRRERLSRLPTSTAKAPACPSFLRGACSRTPRPGTGCLATTPAPASASRGPLGQEPLTSWAPPSVPLSGSVFIINISLFRSLGLS